MTPAATDRVPISMNGGIDRSPSAVHRGFCGDLHHLGIYVPGGYRRAIELREAIYRIFRSKMLSEAPRAAELLVLNEVLAAVPPRVRIAPSGGRLGWWTGATRSGPSDLLAPIAWSAADLMTGARAQRVRQCEDNKGCGWLFLDESRAGTRRWCSMGDCGNRAKARRHYLRSRQLETAGSGHEGDAERAEADLTGEQGE
jgi:predicted RNA-binding Zn ribbon-like protein